MRFRNAVDIIVFRFVKLCHEKGVTEIIVGDASGIRENNDKNAKVNAMIHNFWSFGYIIERLRTTAENFGIKVKFVNEAYTSSFCPFCGTRGKRITRGLFSCYKCNQVINADVVGCLNIAKKCKVIIPNPYWRGRDNGVLAHPLLLRAKPLEARIFSL